MAHYPTAAHLNVMFSRNYKIVYFVQLQVVPFFFFLSLFFFPKELPLNVIKMSKEKRI